MLFRSLAAAQREALEPRPFFDAPGLPSRTGCTIGVDVGGTKIALGMFDNERVLLRRTQFPADKDLAPEAFFDGIIDACLELMRDSGAEASDVRGIGVAMPSYVNYEEGRIVKTANLPLLKDFPAGTEDTFQRLRYMDIEFPYRLINVIYINMDILQQARTLTNEVADRKSVV